MPKKTAAAKRKTTARKSTAKKTAPATKKKTTSVNKPAGKRGGMHRELNPDTGFVVGTDQDTIALALMEGGASRAEIVERLEKSIDTETRNGTPKQITNMTSGVLNKLIQRGYIVESNFQVLPPTPASKRAATRAANKKSAAPAKKSTPKKTTAKKTAAKRGPGRPKGSKNKKK